MLAFRPSRNELWSATREPLLSILMILMPEYFSSLIVYVDFNVFVLWWCKTYQKCVLFAPFIPFLLVKSFWNVEMLVWSFNQFDCKFQEAICDLLDEGGQDNLMIAVCREASEKSARAFWAFRWLGYLQVSFCSHVMRGLLFRVIALFYRGQLLSFRLIIKTGLKPYRAFNKPYVDFLLALICGRSSALSPIYVYIQNSYGGRSLSYCLDLLM